MNVLEILYDAYADEHQESEEVKKLLALCTRADSVQESDMIFRTITDGLFQESKDGFTAGFKAAISIFTLI